ncbi:SigE family RNA polymerase sigma factor [Nocardioides sp.]|uniref:RNA polymerase sigma factor n=1 Tax=Nocardioides sp. TaxID=35761 RepID=UPI00261FD684|nr:SigE family RNA polymerase sigma factor [Nocardioides sp.]
MAMEQPGLEDFEAFVAAHERSLRRTAYLMCGDWARAEDATQDGLLKLYRSWPRLDRGPALRSYAHRAVTTAVLDQARRPWRRERAGEVPDAPPSSGADPDRRLVVLAALADLPARRRACLVLRYFADLTVEETADVLGVSTGTVKSTTARALDQLRGTLGAAGLTLLLED